MHVLTRLDEGIVNKLWKSSVKEEAKFIGRRSSFAVNLKTLVNLLPIFSILIPNWDVGENWEGNLSEGWVALKHCIA